MISLSFSTIIIIFLIAVIVGMVIGITMTRPHIH